MTRALLVAALMITGPATADDKPDLADRYQTTVNKIIDATLAGNSSWQKLVELCDDIGHRLSGSKALDQAIVWAVKTMKADGHENVHTEKVMVPKWVRGAESCHMLEPRPMELKMLGLGGSVATPKGGITAEVAVVRDEKELKALGSGAKGKIVLFANRMPAYDAQKGGSGYGHTVRFRGHGARMASELGAVAVLVRSVTAYSLHTPHTGAMRYGDAKRKIPAAALTVEDAAMLERFAQRGKRVKVRLKMSAKDHGMVPSANVVAEIRGSEKPEEVVIISGHLDAWDVGTGAHDDGAGCVMAMEALTVLRKLGLRPRRTIRAILWTNEENGLKGGKTYARDHHEELSNHVAAIEADSGSFEPKGFSLRLTDPEASKRGVKTLGRVLALLHKTGATHAKAGWAGADISPMAKHNVPLMGLRMDGSLYFNTHHTAADTVDKVDPHILSKNVASMAALAFVLADMPGRLGD